MVDTLERPTTSPLADAALSVLVWPGAGQANQGRAGLAAYLALESLACVVVFVAMPSVRIIAGMVFLALVAWAGLDAFREGRRILSSDRVGTR